MFALQCLLTIDLTAMQPGQRLCLKLGPSVQGEVGNPGVVPRAIQHVFDIIEKTPSRDFLLRMSMMEIYNEVRGTALVSCCQDWCIA